MRMSAYATGKTSQSQQVQSIKLHQAKQNLATQNCKLLIMQIKQNQSTREDVWLLAIIV